MDIAVIVAGLAVYAWLLIIVYRQGVKTQLPWFVLYVVWEMLAASVQLVLLPVNPKLYVAVYWWMEAIEIGLIVATVRESFLRIFQGFTRKPGFRWAVWSVIVAVVSYSAWKSIHAPPLESSRLDAFVFGAEFLFRWGIAGIAVLTTVLGLLMKEGITREDAVVVGFGAASIAFVLYVNSFSLFGAKYIFLTKYIPSVGYFVAAFWWIYVFSRPVRQFGFEELGMGPDEIRKVLRRYRDSGERL
ncbi:MAG TPA: hypothetical protein VKY85_07220 [Candidatus Angelobacter sp.]|nr:hypothetical protein [Candidatus Angelobacter sp.]